MAMQRFPIFLLAISATIAASAQSSTPPPVKMGLWETTVTTQTSGIQLPPDVVAKLKAMGRPLPGGAHTQVNQSCLTPDQWQKDMNPGKTNDADCKTDRHVNAGGKYSIDMTCNSDQGGSTVSHFEFQPLDKEHVRGSGHMESHGNGQNITMSMTLNSHYLGANCGDVKPGEGKTIRHD